MKVSSVRVRVFVCSAPATFTRTRMARPCLLQTMAVDFVWPGLTGTVIYCLSGKQPLHREEID
ncbi:hypothetical protein T4D_9416 [Trichinella pseudospiralis]|uniref:Uncharacterized protein n=1 Tax=Trichinella pseudospiralis TaxID=6337 RepID=A0A0V1FPQ3_TRIPS|nr:hypothetical protein T4D_9416 [Trichinella pseudospiralis]